MIAVGMVLLWIGYTGVYVGVYRLIGDKRNVQDIFSGVSGSANGGNSGGVAGSKNSVTPPETQSQLETQQQMQKLANSPFLTVGPNQGAGPLKPGTTAQIPNPDYKPPIAGR